MKWLVYALFLALLIVFWFGVPWLIRLDERPWERGFDHQIKAPPGFVPVWRGILAVGFVVSIISVIRN